MRELLHALWPGGRLYSCALYLRLPGILESSPIEYTRGRLPNREKVKCRASENQETWAGLYSKPLPRSVKVAYLSDFVEPLEGRNLREVTGFLGDALSPDFFCNPAIFFLTGEIGCVILYEQVKSADRQKRQELILRPLPCLLFSIWPHHSYQPIDGVLNH